ncbi:hypothetical protein LTS10_005128 [Elasticomyces elasticus]|nr:hypothetical protein LTS10_005128 [Elasticomyces elasticus]
MTSVAPNSGLLERVQSSLHGLGLAAAQPILRGTLLLKGTRASHNGPLAWQTCGDLSFLNHSCTPNIEVSYLPDTQTWNVHAIRNVSTGEELLASYVDPYQAKLSRQTGLDFGCRCAVCRFPASELAESDVRRSMIGTSLQTLTAFRARHFSSLPVDDPMRLDPVGRVSFAADVQVPGINGLAGRILKDAKDEGLHDCRSALTYDAAAVTNYFLRCVQANGSGEMEEVPLQRSIEDQQQQLQWLIACLGKSHPRSRSCLTYVSACRMVLGELQHPRGSSDKTPSVPSSENEDEDASGPLLEGFASEIHGKGLRATRKIKEGTLLLSEDFSLTLPGKSSGEQLLLTKLRAAPDKAKAHLLQMIDISAQLVKQWPRQKWPAYKKPLRTTNDLDQAIDGDSEKIAQFLRNTINHFCFPFVRDATEYHLTPNSWSMNHGCRPNAQASWDPETRRVNVYAIDDIAQGSEISIPYINIYRTKPVRRQLLGFGEDCKCTVCSMEEYDSKQFQEREEAMDLYATNWKRLKAWRKKHPQQASTLTADVASAIVGDAECYLMLQLILDMEARADGMIIGITSDYSFFYEVASFLRMALYVHQGNDMMLKKCLEDKHDEWSGLHDCLGHDHPRTGIAWDELQRMKRMGPDSDHEEDNERGEDEMGNEEREGRGEEMVDDEEEGDREVDEKQEVQAGDPEGGKAEHSDHADDSLMESDDALASIVRRLNVANENGEGM